MSSQSKPTTHLTKMSEKRSLKEPILNCGTHSF